MEFTDEVRRHGSWVKFFSDFRAIFIKTWRLTQRKPGQTVLEILLAYAFLGFLLGMRHILDRRSLSAMQIPTARPQDLFRFNSFGSTVYYHPNNTCASTIVNNAVLGLSAVVPGFPNRAQVIPDPSLSTLSNATLSSIIAYIQFTNLDSCRNRSMMPDRVEYKLRMQENGPFYFHTQRVKIPEGDYLWRRAPEDFCRDSSSYFYYAYRLVGIQHMIDASIIKYVTQTPEDLTSKITLNHFGCPSFHLDQFHAFYSFFIPIFFSIIFVVTFIMSLGYIVEERQNKTKEYLRIYGLRTWINNLVWMTRSMIIYFILVGVVTGFSFLVLPSSGARSNSVSKALFNYTHWTLIWTILFVYSIHVSAFTVFFGQLFKQPLLAKLVGFVVWVLTFIDYYPGVPVGLRYFLCLFPNTGLLFCLQVVLQYERKSAGVTTFGNLYTNLFSYQLYIGLCLLLMLIYSVIYFFLAIYVERVNPGEFGISQPFYYLFMKSYWKPKSKATVQPFQEEFHHYRVSLQMNTGNRWIEKKADSESSGDKSASLVISHLTKKYGKVTAVSDLTLSFYKGEVCSLLGHNGAGKTTTTFILVGMLEPTAGHVTVEGLDIRSNIQTIRKLIGFCPQYDILYNELTVEEHLLLIGRMRHLKPDVLTASVNQILEIIGLTNDRQTLSKNLSGGMKRRLSIGISLIGDPKVLILDEPTSGIDPYNRRLIWTIIRKMKEAGKCVLLTTHFLEEADVLSDRIAIMSSGHLQAYGTADFLKKQIEFEYRLFIDKQETCDDNRLISFVHNHLPNSTLEQQSTNQMVFGILRDQTKQIGKLITALEGHKDKLSVDGYGLSMITIEEVFLKLVEEEQKNVGDHTKLREDLANRVFRATHERCTGMKHFWLRMLALLMKRFHVARRQYIFLFGFFIIPIIVEILIVSILPTPKEIQVSLTQNDRVADAQRTFDFAMYNPHTIPLFGQSVSPEVRSRLISMIQNARVDVEELPTDTVFTYVREKYAQSVDNFLNKYQMGLSVYADGTTSAPSIRFNASYSTVNYHAIPTVLNLASTSLFQFYANSSSKRIIATNQPILTPSTFYTALERFFDVVYCFDTLPLSLFNFINSILASLFMSILIVPIIQERLHQSKDLQLLTNLSKRAYWLSNALFDFGCCLVLSILLIVIIRIGSVATTDFQSESYIYINTTQAGLLFLLLLLYCCASLPLIYVYSFSPKSALLGFINYFVFNVIACFLDMILAFMALFSQGQLMSINRLTRLSSVTNDIRWVIAVLFPSVNLKRSLFNLRLRSNADCMAVLNSIMLTNYSFDEFWTSLREPGVGLQIVIFFVQILFWWLMLLLVESGKEIKLFCQQCCGGDTDLDKVRADQPLNQDVEMVPMPHNGWDDSHLDEDVRHERRMVVQENATASSSVVVVRDLVRRFKKRKDKETSLGIFTAVDHLSFRIPKRSCFGLLGANGAGKTTTFRMLINDLRPTSGQILISGKNIHRKKRDVDIGFCPQFDWLMPHLTVAETITLFARLKGLKWNTIDQLCKDMIDLFGLEEYANRKVDKLSGGNKRKVSSVLAFMGNPNLVFLDEPTTGLDAGAKRKLWQVIRAARDIGLTIVMTSHSMEECEALCTKIGIMKLGQFVCFGNLQRLKNRFGNGYAVQVKVPLGTIDAFKDELILTLPGVEIEEQHNGMLYCTVPFSMNTTSPSPYRHASLLNLSHIFELFAKKKEEKVIESYAITQTTLEQIFVHLTEDSERPVKKKKSMTVR